MAITIDMLNAMKLSLYLGTAKTLSEAIELRDRYSELRKQDGYTERHYK